MYIPLSLDNSSTQREQSTANISIANTRAKSRAVFGMTSNDPENFYVIKKNK